mgnify:CR=1 FL=1
MPTETTSADSLKCLPENMAASMEVGSFWSVDSDVQNAWPEAIMLPHSANRQPYNGPGQIRPHILRVMHKKRREAITVSIGSHELVAPERPLREFLRASELELW